MKKYSMETMVGVFVVIGLVCVGYMAVKLGKLSLFGEETYPLYARFASVSALREGGAVEIFGIDVGTVRRLSIDSEKQMALVEMRVNKGVKIYDDATATLKTSGLIGDKFVKIDPGGAGELLKPGGTITETSVTPDVEDLVGKYAFGDVNKDSQKTGDKPAK
jgi:phospholipid/cholesterol/gamma-HCH transport system substrate-binding protein